MCAIAVRRRTTYWKALSLNSGTWTTGVLMECTHAHHCCRVRVWETLPLSLDAEAFLHLMRMEQTVASHVQGGQNFSEAAKEDQGSHQAQNKSAGGEEKAARICALNQGIRTTHLPCGTSCLVKHKVSDLHRSVLCKEHASHGVRTPGLLLTGGCEKHRGGENCAAQVPGLCRACQQPSRGERPCPEHSLPRLHVARPSSWNTCRSDGSHAAGCDIHRSGINAITAVTTIESVYQER